ncbi:MAG: DUF1549 domain-containing protein [Myxococcales bacterium]|nr:DUF1549 domain-containing protein [Myxococcales bacterium]
MRRPLTLMTTVALAALLTSASALAEAPACKPSSSARALQYLRRLSLDLLGRVPTMAEIDAVKKAGEVSAESIDTMLSSAGFVQQMRAYHRGLLWTNVRNVRMSSPSFDLVGFGGVPMAMRGYRAYQYRGDAAASCLDVPALFDPNGKPITVPHPTLPGARQEGYVMVEPYWAPGTQIKVCAFDANAAEEVNGKKCWRPDAGAECGCGPNLRYCQRRSNEYLGSGIYGGVDTQRIIADAFAEQMLRFIDDVVRSDRPYTDLLVASDMEVNGPIAHYLRYQTKTRGFTDYYADPDQDYKVPDLKFSDQGQWVKVARGGRHAGILTMPGYLLRFQTNRGRANRFYNAFLCKQFAAPPSGLPSGADPCNSEPDLKQRCGCSHCHTSLEPLAAYWGRFAESGLAPLSDMVRFPNKLNSADLATCEKPGLNFLDKQICQRFFLLDPGHPKEQAEKGKLRPYVFATKEIEDNIELGPGALAQKAIASGELASCTVKKMLGVYLGTSSDSALVDKLAASFRAGGRYSLRALVRSIVTDAAYLPGGLGGGK